MYLQMTVEGVSDRRIVKQIEKKAQELAKRSPHAGDWSVLVAPSEHRGTWDIGVRGGGGHQFASFRVEPAELPQLVDDQIRAALAATAPVVPGA